MVSPCAQAGDMALRAAAAAEEAAQQRAAAEAELEETRTALADERRQLGHVQACHSAARRCHPSVSGRVPQNIVHLQLCLLGSPRAVRVTSRVWP